MMKHRYVARILSCLLAVTLAFSLAACGKTDDAQGAQTEGSEESSQPTESAEIDTNDEPAESADTASESGDTSQGGSKILIAYFTAAKNSGVDAVSSASYTTINGTAVGRLRAMTDMIQENTDGDLFSIQNSVVYPADGEELIGMICPKLCMSFVVIIQLSEITKLLSQ